MKIIISPSKGYRLNESVSDNLDINTPRYILNADYINNMLSNLSKEQIKEYFKLKNDDIVDKEYDNIIRYHNEDEAVYQALNYYNGICFKEIKRSDELDTYYNEYLRILSAKYGILCSGDLIKPYRLDFTVNREINYFKYYKDIIHNDLIEEDFVINLASDEFSKLLNRDNFVTIVFKQSKDGKVKQISSYCKKARGQYLSYLALNSVLKKSQLKNFNSDGYKLVEEKDNEIIFLKVLS